MDLPKRKPIRLKGYDYSKNGMYFITICTKDRKEILWSTDVGDGVLDVPKYDGVLDIPKYDGVLDNHDITSDKNNSTSDKQICNNRVLLCCAYDIGNVFLSEYGIAIQNQINNMNKIYHDFKIIQYVIMPNHIHLIIKIDNADDDLSNGTSRTTSNGTSNGMSTNANETLRMPFPTNANGTSRMPFPTNANGMSRMPFPTNANGTSRTPSPTNAIIPKFISTFKRFVNKNFGYNIFQRSYHDHIIRNKKEYEIISKYIYENPLKWKKDCYYVSKDNKNTEVKI